MYKNIKDYLLAKTGIPYEVFIKDTKKKYSQKGLSEIYQYIMKTINEEGRITIVPDYDTDGIMSLSILYLLLMKISAAVKKKAALTICVPHRFSDGYGLSETVTERIPVDTRLLILIDNGIAAKEQIAAVKERNPMTQVVIMDHHEQVGELPDAEVIVDPEVLPEGWDYTHYCGAGLAWKLTDLIYGEADPAFVEQITALAAIATIGDVVELLGENREIVKRGLKTINEDRVQLPVKRLLTLVRGKDKVEYFDETAIAFKIVPLLNAAGRLYDDGAEKSMAVVLGQLDPLVIHEINEKRKVIQKEALEKAEPIGDKIKIIDSDDIPEGICGVIAAKLVEEYNQPAFVMTKNEKIEKTLKGSARADKANDLMELLAAVRPSAMVQYGGHKEAAGFCIKWDMVGEFLHDIEAVVKPPVKPEADIEIQEKEVMENYIPWATIKPFGVGIENPLIKLTVDISDASLIGAEKTTVKVDRGVYTIIGFHLADQLKACKNPKEAVVYGRFSNNYYNGHVIPQFQMESIEN